MERRFMEEECDLFSADGDLSCLFSIPFWVGQSILSSGGNETVTRRTTHFYGYDNALPYSSSKSSSVMKICLSLK